MSVAAIFQLATPFTEDELFDIGFDQAADAMLLAHLNHPTQKLLRFDHNDWTIAPMTVGADIAQVTGLTVGEVIPIITAPQYQPKTWVYTVCAVDDERGIESLPATSEASFNDLSLHGNYNLISWDAMPGATSYNIYKGDVASLGFIGNSISTDFRDDNVLPDYSDSYPRERNPFDGPGNYPATVTFFQQRTLFARTRNAPAAVFASRSADLFNHNASLPLQDDDALSFSVAARRVNAIRHLVPLKKLIALTTDSLFSISGSNGYLSPSDINIDPEGYRGSSGVRPVVVDDVIFFNTSRGATIRTLGYTFERDGYAGNDLTVFAQHFFKGFTIKDMAWAEEPTKTIWIVRSDGALVALTWMQEQDVWGWTLCSTDGLFESCCVISEGGEDVLYVVVQRTINGVAQRHVERLTSTQWANLEDAVHVDAARTYRGDPATVIGGLFYLEGKTVSVLADGSASLGHVVENGQITLDAPASVVTVGLPYEPWVKTLPLVPELRSGSVKGQPQTISEVSIHVLRTRGIEVALGKAAAYDENGPVEPTQAQDEAKAFYTPRTRTDEALSAIPGLYSGVLNSSLDSGDFTEPQAVVVIRQRYPLPMFLAGVTPGLEVGG